MSRYGFHAVHLFFLITLVGTAEGSGELDKLSTTINISSLLKYPPRFRYMKPSIQNTDLLSYPTIILLSDVVIPSFSRQPSQPPLPIPSINTQFNHNLDSHALSLTGSSPRHRKLLAQRPGVHLNDKDVEAVQKKADKDATAKFQEALAKFAKHPHKCVPGT
jgi:hypothetical protein